MTHSNKKRAPKTSEEFERFRDFTRRLIAVPKKEIDQQKAKYERKKATRKKQAA